VKQLVKKKALPNGSVEERLVDETVGGVLQWGRESSKDMDWFRTEIRKVYGGRAPKVLDFLTASTYRLAMRLRSSACSGLL